MRWPWSRSPDKPDDINVGDLIELIEADVHVRRIEREQNTNLSAAGLDDATAKALEQLYRQKLAALGQEHRC